MFHISHTDNVKEDGENQWDAICNQAVHLQFEAFSTTLDMISPNVTSVKIATTQNVRRFLSPLLNSGRYSANVYTKPYLYPSSGPLVIQKTRRRILPVICDYFVYLFGQQDITLNPI